MSSRTASRGAPPACAATAATTELQTRLERQGITGRRVTRIVEQAQAGQIDRSLVDPGVREAAEFVRGTSRASDQAQARVRQLDLQGAQRDDLEQVTGTGGRRSTGGGERIEPARDDDPAARDNTEATRENSRSTEESTRATSTLAVSVARLASAIERGGGAAQGPGPLDGIE